MSKLRPGGRRLFKGYLTKQQMRFDPLMQGPGGVWGCFLKGYLTKLKPDCLTRDTSEGCERSERSERAKRSEPEAQKLRTTQANKMHIRHSKKLHIRQTTNLHIRRTTKIIPASTSKVHKDPNGSQLLEPKLFTKPKGPQPALFGCTGHRELSRALTAAGHSDWFLPIGKSPSC